MTIRLGIFIITAFVFVLVVAIALCRAAQIGEQAEAELFKRICADKERERLMADELDTTRFYGDDAR